MKIKKKQIQIPILNHSVFVLQASDEDMRTYLSALYNENMYDISTYNTSAMCILIKGQIYIWWRLDDDIELSILSHEIIHACYAIFKSRGFKLDDEELMCYLHQYILDEILCLLDQTTNVDVTEVTDPLLTVEDELQS